MQMTLSPRDADQMRTLAAIIHNAQRGEGCDDFRALITRDGDPSYAVEVARSVLATFVMTADCMRATGRLVDAARTILNRLPSEAPDTGEVNVYIEAAHKAAHAAAALAEHRHGRDKAVALTREQVERFAVGDFGDGVVLE